MSASVIEGCFLPKLAKNYDENDIHPEYILYKNKLDERFNAVLKSIQQNFSSVEDMRAAPNMIVVMFILYEELNGKGPWCAKQAKKHAQVLKNLLLYAFDITLDEVLQKDNVFIAQHIFDGVIDYLHKKLTCDDFKKYPSLIGIYFSIVSNLKEYSLDQLNPMKVLPAALLLMDDHDKNNKVKGLICCKCVLQQVSLNDFQGGNYYEVIEGSLMRTITHKDREVTQFTLDCIIQILQIMPTEIKVHKSDKLFATILDQLHTESNLYRKAILFNYTSKIIEMHKVNCASKNKMFCIIICDSLDACCTESIRDILLLNILECLETWIKHCWCVWNLKSDYKLLSLLFKILFINALKEEFASKIVMLVSILLVISSENGNKQILECLENTNEFHCEPFARRIEEIKKNLNKEK